MAADLDNLHNEIFSIKCIDFSSPSPDPLCSRRLAYAGVKEGYPSKNGYSSAIGLSNVKMVPDRHRHAAYHNKH